MKEENKVFGIESRWLIVALIFFILWLTSRKIKKSVLQVKRYFDSFLLDYVQKKYNVRMYSRKKALLFDGLSQMMENTGRPLRVLEIGAGTGANFPYYPDSTIVSCIEPVAQFNKKLIAAAGGFPRLQFEFHDGFAEDMAVIESGSVDAVVSTLVLCSVTDVDRCLKEVIRVLKPVSIKRFF